MADFEEVANAIATQLDTIGGLQIHVEPPGTVDPPAVIIELGSIDYDSSMDRGSDDVNWTLSFIGDAHAEGIRNLYQYLNGTGEKSVKACFHGNPTLDGAVMYAVITNSEKPDRVDIGQTEFYRVPVNLTTSVAGDL